MVAVAGKSRGCATCRRRRVACDLAKPTCNTCKRLKIHCDGYDRFPVFINRTVSGRIKSSFLEEIKTQPWPSSDDAAPPTVRPALSLLSGLQQRDWRALQYFHEVSMWKLAGALDPYFWRMIVPARGQVDHSVRHLMLTIAGLHEKWRTQVLPQVAIQEPLSAKLGPHNYDTKQDAMRHPKADALISSLLVIVIHLFQGNAYSAFCTIARGRSLLDQDAVNDSTPEELLVIFERYQKRIRDGLAVQADGKPRLPSGSDADICTLISQNLVNFKTEQSTVFSIQH